MQTVIVPIDFSDTSTNAAEYAVQLLTGHYGVNMILYHIYDKSSEEADAMAKLEKLSQYLRTKGIVKTELMARQGSDFIDELDKLARHRVADLIVMGITDRSLLGQSLIGSNSLKMVERNVCPVLIIPPDARYKIIKNVMLTSDFKSTKDTTPSVPIKKILKTFQPNFFVLNVDSAHYVSITEEYQKEKDDLAAMFHEFNPEFFFVGLSDTQEAINQFGIDKKIDIIIVIHKEQNLFSKLFSKSNTKLLAYQSTIPTLALKE
jgi:nucleotide-binding universal stress UspA family protein